MARNPVQTLEGQLSRAATAGVFFATVLSDPDGLTALKPKWPNDLDLQLDWDKASKAWVISGQIMQPKLYELTLMGKRHGKPVVVNLRLPVSPDPWTIWKDLPVDWDVIPYPKSDTNSCRIDGKLTLIGAGRRGRGHAHMALPRDDDMRIFYDVATDWHIAVVADGTGSAVYSRFGAQTAVECVVDQLPLLLAKHMPALPCNTSVLAATLGVVTQNAAQAIADIAADAGHRSQDYSTTLLIGIAKHGPDGWFFASISIGDGLIGLVAGDTPPLMMSSDAGEYAGQTMFLRPKVVAEQKAIAARIHQRIVPDFKPFLRRTDGVSDPMFASEIAETKAGN